jgi:hypothetical protein
MKEDILMSSITFGVTVNENDLPTFDDVVDYVIRDLRTIGSLVNPFPFQNAWQDILALVRGRPKFQNVYASTVEGIVHKELERLPDEVLMTLWRTSPLVADRRTDRLPSRNQIVNELARCAFARVYSRASHELATA